MVAYVIREEGYEDSGTLLRNLKGDLPDYMLPSAIVTVEEWPRLPNGKLDKERLPDPQEKEVLVKKEVYVAPRDEIERKLATIWSDLLGIQRVSIYDDFFALGGYSLLTIQLARQIKTHFGIRISLTTIFRERSIAAIAQFLHQQWENSSWASEREHTQEAVHLLDDAILDSSIVPEARSAKSRMNEYEHMLLTGATGFLGTFLLAELLRQTSMHIHCLVRATTEAEGKQKLQQKLEEANIWQAEWGMRIHPLIGDLAQPQLGLSSQDFHKMAQKIDIIYHNGAHVNMMYPYEILKPANVLGTKEIIRLAMTHQLKPLHYISTLDILGHKDEEQIQYLGEHTAIDNLWQHLHGGYAQSKWVAEKLVQTARTRGLPVVIYRPGTITGFPLRRALHDDGILPRLLRGCIELGKAPVTTREATLQMMPVDFVSRAIVVLSQQDTSPGEIFHFSKSSQVEINEIIQWLNTFGYAVQPVAYEEWYKAVMRLSETRTSYPKSTEDDTLADLLPLLPKSEQLVNSSTSEKRTPSVVFGGEFTQATLAELSLRYPEINENLFHTYLTSLIQVGYLPSSKQKEGVNN